MAAGTHRHCCALHHLTPPLPPPHRAAIEKLRQQNARLKEDLLLENKFSVRPSNPGASLMINKLQDEADLYTRKVRWWWRVVRVVCRSVQSCSSV
jgi:hypothetical protein